MVPLTAAPLKVVPLPLVVASCHWLLVHSPPAVLLLLTKTAVLLLTAALTPTLLLAMQSTETLNLNSVMLAVALLPRQLAPANRPALLHHRSLPVLAGPKSILQSATHLMPVLRMLFLVHLPVVLPLPLQLLALPLPLAKMPLVAHTLLCCLQQPLLVVQ